MGSHPHQYIMWGVACFNKDKIAELDEGVDVDLMSWCEENGVEFEFGGNAQACIDNDVVVGFKYTYHNGRHHEDDFANYQTHPLDLVHLHEWVEMQKVKMTPKLVAKIQQVLGVADKPALWTVANYG